MRVCGFKFSRNQCGGKLLRCPRPGCLGNAIGRNYGAVAPRRREVPAKRLAITRQISEYVRLIFTRSESVCLRGCNRKFSFTTNS